MLDRYVAPRGTPTDNREAPGEIHRRENQNPEKPPNQPSTKPASQSLRSTFTSPPPIPSIPSLPSAYPTYSNLCNRDERTVITITWKCSVSCQDVVSPRLPHHFPARPAQRFVSHNHTHISTNNQLLVIDNSHDDGEKVLPFPRIITTKLKVSFL